MEKKLSDKIKRVIRYIKVTSLGTIISLGSFFIFESILEIHYFWAGIFSFLLAATHNFLGIKFFAFQCKHKNALQQYFKYLTVAVLALTIHQFIFVFIMEKTMINYPLLVKFIVGNITYIFSFWAHKKYTFKHAHVANTASL